MIQKVDLKAADASPVPDVMWSVIYSVDFTSATPVAEVAPRDRRKKVRSEHGNLVPLWYLTEKDNQYDGDWEEGRHRKWCAVLSWDQFNKFVDDLILTPEGLTAGSIGAPGCGYGCVPAFSFRGPPSDYWAPVDQSAYCTPMGTPEQMLAFFSYARHEADLPPLPYAPEDITEALVLDHIRMLW